MVAALPDCRCAKIMSIDPTRHFKGCPCREAFPEVQGPPAPFGDKGEDERLGFPLQLDVLQSDAECGACGQAMKRGDPLIGYALGPIDPVLGYRPEECCVRGTRCMECALGSLARMRTRTLAGEFDR